MKRITLIISALIISITGFSQATGKLVLNKGQKLQVETKGNSIITQELMGQSMEIKADINSISALEVNDATTERYTMTNTLTGMKMNLSVMGQDMKFDSEKKEDLESEMGAGFKDVLNQPKTLVVNGVAQTLPDTSTKAGLSADKMGQVEQMMSGMFGAFSSHNVNPAFEIIPTMAVKGHSWTDSSTNEGVSRKTTYTVKDINGNEAIVLFEGTINTNSKTEAQGMEVTTKQTGTIKGEMLVDISTGVLKEKKSNVETSGTAEVMGQEIPMSSKLSLTTTVKSL